MERPTHAGLRHLALNVRDLPAMKRFYVALLGFVVEWEPNRRKFEVFLLQTF
jgi:catechol 2,3-dioxygenase-like lactoylglutathione lyase family enzyme